jgi:hypothetical protein
MLKRIWLAGFQLAWRWAVRTAGLAHLGAARRLAQFPFFLHGLWSRSCLEASLPTSITGRQSSSRRLRTAFSWLFCAGWLILRFADL